MLVPSMRMSPLGELDQPVDELERGRLPAAGRADEHADLARGDGERQALDGRALSSRVAFRRLVEDELGGLARHPENYVLQECV